MRAQPLRSPSSEWTVPVDDELVQRIVARLQDRLGSQVSNFQMSGGEEGLILRGQVGTFYGKQLTQEVVIEVSGLMVLANDIEVRGKEVTPQMKIAAK